MQATAAIIINNYVFLTFHKVSVSYLVPRDENIHAIEAVADSWHSDDGETRWLIKKSPNVYKKLPKNFRGSFTR